MASSLSLIFNTMFSAMFVEIYSMQSSFAVHLLRSDELWIYDQIIYEYYSSLLWTLLCMIKIAFVFLSDLLIWFGQLDWFFLQWERCLVMGSILRCSILVTEGDITYCIIAIKEKRMGFIHAWVYFVYIMSCCLRRYSVLYELNTLDACWIAAMCGLVVVDAGRNRSTCLGRDAYIHWSLPRISSWLFAFLSIVQ